MLIRHCDNKRLDENNSRKISPENYRHTIRDGRKTFEIKDIEGAVGTRFFHNIGNPNHHGRYELVCKQEMVVCRGAKGGSRRIRKPHTCHRLGVDIWGQEPREHRPVSCVVPPYPDNAVINNINDIKAVMYLFFISL